MFDATKRAMIHQFIPEHLEIAATNSESEHAGEDGNSSVHDIGGDVDVDAGHDAEGQESSRALRVIPRERHYDEDQVGGEDSVRVSLHTASVLVALLIEASPSH